ncbi:quinone-dependent dihydroorotate dehydrogenase [Companilactobacillus ginsenosidimutans]|uniref:Dihydroorotate dehydrogenase (quinone) n=1 Tax=Companilactobacillus ginsenosidimutans TaxID=1007676 RepID=A0A0H4QYC7_9LACO|nr:quinone-dependent dihydroorotate dehydrogenase [Companilactobacillus ginsenosidimutans]AKP66470.1 dihydroorotate dehydrogenase [Companilactobacillus ginsenosidimutans]
MDWYQIARPMIFAVDPEIDHHLVANGLKIFNQTPQVLQKMFYTKKRNNLKTTIKGVTFDSPIGIAAGFDKNAEFYNSLGALGAGFVEVGSVTRSAQEGNPKKRIFRLPEDKAIINRMGLNNVGLDKVMERLSDNKRNTKVGLSLAPTHGLSTDEMINELVDDVKQSHDLADYIALNLSCPNQAGVMSLQKSGVLIELLGKISDLMIDEPVFCKFSSDLTTDELLETLDETANLMDGVILSNTSLDRTDLQSENKVEKGGLSGKPIFEKSLALTTAVYEKFGEELPIIFSGGVFDYHDAYKALQSGASLVQVYTGFIYNGPSQIEHINRHLSEMRMINSL